MKDKTPFVIFFGVLSSLFGTAIFYCIFFILLILSANLTSIRKYFVTVTNSNSPSQTPNISP